MKKLYKELDNLLNEKDDFYRKINDIDKKILFLKKQISEKIKGIELNYSYLEIIEAVISENKIKIYVLDYEEIHYLRNIEYFEKYKFNIFKNCLVSKSDNEYTKDIKSIDIKLSVENNIDLEFFYKDELNFEKFENSLNDLRQKIKNI